MFLTAKISVILISWALSCYSQTETQENFKISSNCRERNRLINTEKGDLYAIIDASIGEKLTLLCHYCNENDDGRPKIWYKIEHFGRSNDSREVQIGMENNSTKNRIHVNAQHSLIVNSFIENDTGLYYCSRTEVHDEDEKYNYLVEVTYDVNVTAMETGNFTAWKQYHEDYFAPVNKMFAESRGEEFVTLRNMQKTNLELVTQWDPFGICEICGRPQGQGVKSRKGYCRIKLTHNVNEYFMINRKNGKKRA